MPRRTLRPHRLRPLRAALGSLLVALGLAAGPEPEAVVLQLKWRHQFQFAGYYAALEKGYYREAGLEVQLREGGPDTDPVREVVEGRAQFGVGTSSLLLARHRGAPVVVLAVVFQHSPLILLAREEPGMASVHDLRGRRIMLEHQSEELLAFLQKEGLPRTSLQLGPYLNGTEDLVRREVDAMSAYATTEPYFLDQQGVRHLEFSPRAAGIDFYGDNLFTTEAEIARHGPRTQAFREASLRGWRYALQHPDEMIDLIHARYAPGRPKAFLRFEARHTVSLIQPDLIEPGYMHAGRWRHIADTYADLGLLPKEVAVAPLLYDPGAVDRLAQQRLRSALTVVLPLGVLAVTLVLVFLGLNRRLKQEVRARTALAEHLAENERRFRFLAEHSTDVIWTLDPATGRFTYLSPSVQQLRGYTPEEIMARPAEEALTPESAAQVRASLEEDLSALAAGQPVPPRRVEVDQPHRDGRLIPTEVITTLHQLEGNRATAILGVTRDITERRRSEAQLRQAMSSLEQMASTDLLTGAWNRRHFESVVEGEMHRSRRHGHPLTLLLLDIDHFKQVNDTYGHHEGDRVLQVVTDRVRSVIRVSDSLTRWGGEEFIVLMPSTDQESARTLAERIRTAICATPVPGAGTITASLGVAEYLPTASRDAWIERADKALYRAKRAGRDRVEVDPLTAEGLPEGGAQGSFLKLVWKPSYRSGHPVIDAQHESLFLQANALLDAAILGRPEPEIARLVGSLVEDISRHFEDEERVLAEVGFSDREAHGEKHALLLAQSQEIQKAFSEGSLSLGSLFQFLAHDVVAMHMLRADRAFFPLLEMRGGGRPR